MNILETNQEPASREEALDVDLPIVDAHHHLWPEGFRLPYDLAALQADLGRGHNIEATVFVECMTSFRPDGDELLKPVGETEFVVDATAGTTVAAGIVGWADLMQGSSVGRTLDGHLEAGGDRFRGVRFNVVWLAGHDVAAHAGRSTEAHMLLDEGYRAGLREVERRGLTYDIWLYHPQLGELADTVDAFPDLTFVVDHLGGPMPEAATPETVFDEWRTGLTDLSRRPNVVLKVGGVGMPVYGFGFDGTSRPTSAELSAAWRPYVEAAIEAFGPDRCMLESNFPVDKQSFSYDALWNAFKLITSEYSDDERSQLFAGTARRVYKLSS